VAICDPPAKPKSGVNIPLLLYLLDLINSEYCSPTFCKLELVVIKLKKSFPRPLESEEIP